MKLKKVLCISILVLLLTFSVTTSLPIKVSAKPDLPVHNIDTGLDYATIQEAISDPETENGHTIGVDAGIYHEHVTITKSIKLVGEDRDATIVDGNGTGTVIRIDASDISVINLTISNAGRIWGPPPGYGYPDSCILGRNVRNVHIENNTFNGAAVCVAFTDYSSLINISNNVVFNATYIGILGYASYNITIYNNVVFDYGSEGIHLDGGSSYCRIVNNTVKNGFDGISLEKSANNLIDGNYLLDNTLASIGLWRCGTNVFRRNSMTSRQHNLLIWGYDLASFMQDIDDSNTANNKVIYYLKNRSNLLIGPSNYPDLGYIAIVNCTNIVIRDFNLSSNGDGALLARSTNCTLMNITLSDNRGPLIYGGFPLIYGGLMFFESNNNTIVNNKICNNSYGVCLYHSDWNVFYHNSFTHNDRHVVPDFYSPFLNTSSGYFSVSTWDNGFEGNYWSDYDGIDFLSGPYQNQTGSDGIGDTPYTKGGIQDNYPLMGTFSSFDATWEEKTYHVTTICNSTISNFDFGMWGAIGEKMRKAIYFQVTGPDDTIGFCRVCIPTALMNDTYKVFVSGTEVPHTLLSCSNSTHSYLYFTYNHPTKEVIIIPEFPLALILPLLMIFTFVAVALSKKKRHSKDKQYTTSLKGSKRFSNQLHDVHDLNFILTTRRLDGVIEC